jgi:hypothetical protein
MVQPGGEVAARWFALVAAGIALGCGSRSQRVPKPHIVPHSEWQVAPPLGFAADATRRNKRAGDSLTFRDLVIGVVKTSVDSSGAKPSDVVQLALRQGSTREERSVAEGSAFNWNGYHIAVVAIYGPGELGAGLTALEVATVASLPPLVAASPIAGGAELRLRIPQRITHVTLHHTGDSRILTPAEDPAVRLRGLQFWGAAERNWWDVPYHYLLGTDGRIYEGRDHHFMGETNTTYDPGGHFLISIIGNYDRQEPTPALIESIADLMAWAVDEYDVPLDHIGGHYNYATTGCPGKNLKPLLENGTLRRMVQERLKK